MVPPTREEIKERLHLRAEQDELDIMGLLANCGSESEALYLNWGLTRDLVIIFF